MKFIIIGKNIDVTPGLKDAVESKLGKLPRYFTPDTEIHVTLSVQKEHQKIEVTIPVKGNIIRSEQESDDMYVSIDLVEEVIERQLRKYKNKLVAKNQEGNNFSKTLFETEESIEDDEVKDSESNQCIQKTHAYRWNYLDITSLYSSMLRMKKLT